MVKTEIHPKWFNQVPITCDNKIISVTESTKPQLQVDIWLANHPFYLDSQIIVDSEGRVERFMKKYGL